MVTFSTIFLFTSGTSKMIPYRYIEPRKMKKITSRTQIKLCLTYMGNKAGRFRGDGVLWGELNAYAHGEIK